MILHIVHTTTNSLTLHLVILYYAVTAVCISFFTEPFRHIKKICMYDTFKLMTNIFVFHLLVKTVSLNLTVKW